VRQSVAWIDRAQGAVARRIGWRAQDLSIGEPHEIEDMTHRVAPEVVLHAIAERESAAR